MDRFSLTRRRVAAVSAVIVVLLGLQGLAVSRVLCPPVEMTALAPMRVACPPATWPFVDYPMFAEAHYEGETLLHYFAVARTADGEEVRLLPEELDVHPAPRRLVAALLEQDRAAAERYAEEYADGYGAELVEVDLVLETLTLTREGMIAGPPSVRRSIALARSRP